MTYILHIETATSVCSVALSKDEQLLSIRESNNQKSHSSMLAVYIDEILKENNVLPSSLSAISVSKGPGSYTGLRIGVSTAKGLTYGNNIPLIAVNTLKAMVNGFTMNKDYSAYHSDSFLYVPMLDARRMEVYSAIFDFKNNSVREIHAQIIDENSFSDVLDTNKLVFLGNGAAKCKDVIKHKNAIFIDKFELSASYMIGSAMQSYKSEKFEDMAYFEPFYLKDFVATKPKKNILGI